MKAQILSFLFSCIPLLVMQAQTIIPFRNVARTFATDDSIAAESVVPNCIISITDDSKAKINYTFENAVENKSLVDGVNYSHLRIKGFGINTRIGCPQLPGYTDIIAVKTEAPTVRIVSSDYVEYTDFDIFPAQIPETESDTASYPFVKDSTIYATNAFYPQNLVEVQDVQKYRGIPQALVRVNPVQYNPVTRTIRCHSNIVYELDSAMTAEEIEDAVPYEVVAALEDTDTVEALYYTSPDKYIIVTVDKYKSTLTSFVQSKEQLGYKVVVLSKPSWSSSTEVKSAIQTEYDRSENSRPRFLLIVGGHEDVPAEVRYRWGKLGPEWKEQDPYPSDHYYSCVDGENDYWPDLARGRWDINTVSELFAIIEKNINYNQLQQYIGNVALCAEFEYENSDPTTEIRRFIKTSEEVRDYLLNEQNYISARRLYYASVASNPTFYNDGIYADGGLMPEVLRNGDYNWNITCDNVVSEINSGIDFILYRGHGKITNWNNNLFSVNNIDALTNSNKYPFILSVTCLTGRFYDKDSINGTNCLASGFLKKENGGAIGAIAASVASTSGYNDVFTEGMFNAMFPNPGIVPYMGTSYNNNSRNYTPYELSDTIATYAVGEIMNEGFERLIQCYDITYNEELQINEHIQTLQFFHLFGDPSMEIYTGVAQDLNNVTISQVNGRISVNTNGLEDCRIILKPTEDKDSLEFQMVDHLIGTFTFEYSDCDYEIIIQKHNCRPVYKTLTNAHDIYLQNQMQTTNKSYYGNNIFVGKNVTTETSTGDYVVKSGANLELNSTGTVTLSGGFTVEKGGTLEINN